MEREHEVGVYKLYKLGRLTEKTFDVTIKKLDRDLHVVHHAYTDKINAQSEINGLLYEYDDKATRLYWDKKPFKTVTEFTAFEEVKEVPTPKIIEEPIEFESILEKAPTETKEETIERLKKEYTRLTGKEARPLWGVVKLTEEVNKLKS